MHLARDHVAPAQASRHRSRNTSPFPGALTLTRFLTRTRTRTRTWTLTRNRTRTLSVTLTQVLCFTEADAELWDCDPIEFIRTCYDIMEDCTSPRVAASSLMVDLCRKRTKTCLKPMVEFVQSVFRDFAAGAADAGRKDGAMYCFGAIAAQLQEEAVPELSEVCCALGRTLTAEAAGLNPSA